MYHQQKHGEVAKEESLSIITIAIIVNRGILISGKEEDRRKNKGIIMARDFTNNNRTSITIII